MAWWQISEVSKKTGISVRMLRHFDSIDLLKPTTRGENQYRYYSDSDIAILEQIIALRTFGFSLKAVKELVQKGGDISAHLRAQRDVIRTKAAEIHDVLESLDDIIAKLPAGGSPESEDLLQLIRRYQMTKDQSKAWAKKNLNEEQYKAYVAIYDKYPEDFKKLDDLIDKVNKGEMGDPRGPDGEEVVHFQLELLKKTRDTISEQRHLGADVLKSMKAGRVSETYPTPKASLWLMQANLSYWLKRWDKVYDFIEQNLGEDPEGKAGKDAASMWRTTIDEHLCVPPVELAVGTMLWQEIARQDKEYADLKSMPDPKEMAEKIHVKLLFNPSALQWIEKALMTHK